MFRCNLCNKVTPSGTKANFIVLKTRKKFYSSRIKANKGYIHKGGDLKKSKKNADRANDPGGEGFEIVKEVIVCSACAKEHESKN